MAPPRKTWVSVLIATLLLGSAAAAYYFTRPSPPADSTFRYEVKPHERFAGDRSHGSGIDRARAPVLAMLRAPEGTSPCDSAYIAFTTEQTTATAEGKPSMFKWVAGRDEFMTRCQELPEGVQRCLVPRYERRHVAECEPLKPAPEMRDKLFVLNPPVEPQPEPIRLPGAP